jgi:hypothetical protein
MAELTVSGNYSFSKSEAVRCEMVVAVDVNKRKDYDIGRMNGRSWISTRVC